MRLQPEIGDLVRACGDGAVTWPWPGLVIDHLDLDGEDHYEIAFDTGEICWFSDIEIKVID